MANNGEQNKSMLARQKPRGQGRNTYALYADAVVLQVTNKQLPPAHMTFRPNSACQPAIHQVDGTSCPRTVIIGSNRVTTNLVHVSFYAV